MNTCPICGNVLGQENACSLCGFDLGLEYEDYPTFFLVDNQKSLETRRQLWNKTQKHKCERVGLYGCPVCAGTGFFLLQNQQLCICQQCRSAIPFDRVFLISPEMSSSSAVEPNSYLKKKGDAKSHDTEDFDSSSLGLNNTPTDICALLHGLKAEVLGPENARVGDVVANLSPNEQKAFSREQVIVQINCDKNLDPRLGKLFFVQRSQTGNRKLTKLSHLFSLTITNANIYLKSDFGSLFGLQSTKTCSIFSAAVSPSIDPDTMGDVCEMDLRTSSGGVYLCRLAVEEEGDAQTIADKLNSLFVSLRQGRDSTDKHAD